MKIYQPVVFLTALLLSTAAVAAEDDDGTMPKPQRWESSLSLVLPGLPDPIQPQEIEVWTWLLHLSEEQQVFLRNRYRRYVDDADRLYLALLPGLEEEAMPFGRGMAMYSSVPLAEQCAAFVEERIPPVARKLRAVDEPLINDLAAVLSETQRAKIPLIRDYRDRVVDFPWNGRYPGGDVDLVEWFVQRAPESHDWLVSYEDRSDWIASYSRRITPLFRQRLNQNLTLRSRGTLAQVRQLTGVGDRAENVATNLGYRRKQADTEREIAAINDDFLARLPEVVHPHIAAEIIRQYQAEEFSPVYPDPTDVSLLVRRLPGLPDTSATELTEALEHFERERRSICKRMKKRFSEWRTDMAIHGQRGLQQYKQDMLKLHDERVANAHHSIQVMVNAVAEHPEAPAFIDLTRRFQERLALHEVDVEPRLKGE